MKTTHTSVTDAEVIARNLFDQCGHIADDEKCIQILAAGIEQFAQSRSQPSDEADDLLKRLGLDPERYRTDGGSINHMKVRAAIRHPENYPVQPSSEAVELPPLPEPDHAYDCGTTPFYNADQMRKYATAAIKAAHPQPAAPAGVTASKSASVTVTAEGVRFGKNCWYSHERITGYKPERLNLGACSLPARGYMEWVQANLQADTYAAPTVEEGIAALVDALAESKGWMRTYAEAIIKDAIDRKHLEDAAPVDRQGEREVISDVISNLGEWCGNLVKQEDVDYISGQLDRLAALIATPAPTQADAKDEVLEALQIYQHAVESGMVDDDLRSAYDNASAAIAATTAKKGE